MKTTKLAGIGIVLIITLTIVIAMMTGQLTTTHAAGLTTTHAAGLTTKLDVSAKNMKPQNTPLPMPQGIPPQISSRMPAGVALLAHIYARGVLAYACPATAQSAEVPMITLFSDPARTQVIGTHYMDFTTLTWEGLNGDKFVGAPLVKVVVNPNSAPWVLLQRVGHTGNGVFAQATLAERVFTVGGLPHPCNPNQPEIQVPFTTQYLFFGTPNTTLSSR